MSSKTSLWKRIINYPKQWEISTRLTLMYAAVITILLGCACVASVVGMYYVIYHQAEMEMTISVEIALDKIQDPNFMTQAAQKPHEATEEVLLPGVVLRVLNEDGKVVYDTDKHFASVELLRDNFVMDKMFWMSDKYQLVRLKHFMIYYHEVPMEFKGRNYTLVFSRVITAERPMFAKVQERIVLGAALGILLVVLIVYLGIKRAFRPLRDFIGTAKSIEVSDLSARLEVPPSHDEMTELATTFNRMLDRIEEGFKVQQRFVSDASHELRTPVTVIKGYADMLSRWGSSDAETLEEGIQAIKTEAEDMQELIEKLLFLARADQNRQIVNKVPLELSELVEDVYKKLKVTDTRHTIELLRNEEGYILGDKVIMKELIRIFLENGIKYTPEGGTITIDSHAMPRYMCLEIADNGIGIAPEDQEKIFQRFYRVDSSRTKAAGQPGGTGLGLSIAQWIADNHDIGISMESELDKGTKFILMIPVIEEEV
ncbi:Osmosensitive K+ channel histidine kinase KdpD [Anaerovibrio sp. JC8]|uniref:sensor histidine kinase n=1 Tax=Anaerovibrio sp. JC8 TaxID=1240085 RepID=UPI000A0A3439|nr:ATP-binding protein [Anaerovibrio sp. JC8]ORU01043.1 Osmosensitive K+ channel histidine kinase KdpD [Anaerovibrio sp. JC8]